MGSYLKRHFCPFVLLNKYLKLCGNYSDIIEQLFVFSDNSPVQPIHANNLLKDCIQKLVLNPVNYSMHSLRSGRASDLIKYGYSVEQVKCMGRWKSSAVYKYIR